MVIEEEVGIEYVDKTNAAKGWGFGQMLTCMTKGEGGTGLPQFWHHNLHNL